MGSDAGDILGRVFGRLAAPGSASTYNALRFVRHDGCELGCPYSRLDLVEFDPSAGIRVVIGRRVVLVTGYGLRPLYRQIIERTVEEIRARGKATGFEPRPESRDAGEDPPPPVIERVEFESGA